MRVNGSDSESAGPKRSLRYRETTSVASGSRGWSSQPPATSLPTVATAVADVEPEPAEVSS